MLDTNTRKLLKILWIIPVGKVEVERSFSFIRRIHKWLRNSISTGLLGDLAVNVMCDYTILVLETDLSNAYRMSMSIHPDSMMVSSIFISAWLMK